MTITKLTFLTIFCIFFISSLVVIYLSKERFKNNENDIYKTLLVLNLFGLISQFLCGVASYHYNNWPVAVSNIIFKLYLIYFVVFAFMVFQYTFLISVNKKDDYDKYKKVLNISPYKEKDVFYTNGMAVTYVYIVSAILSSLMFLLLVLKNKKIKQKKATPLYFFLVLCFVGMLIQRSNPEMIITCSRKKVNEVRYLFQKSSCSITHSFLIVPTRL